MPDRISSRARSARGARDAEPLRRARRPAAARAPTPSDSFAVSRADRARAVVGDVSVEGILRQVESVSVCVTTADGVGVAAARGLTLTTRPGTRLSATLDGTRLAVSAEPPVEIAVERMPDARVRGLVYDFATGRFEVDAEGLGPDSAYRQAATYAANRYLRARLPPAMQRPGYDPRADKELVPNLRAWLASVSGADGRTGGSAEAPGAAAAGRAAVRLTDPSLFVVFRLEQEFAVPLGRNAQMRFPGDARYTLRASFGGDLRDPRVSEVVLRTVDRPIDVGKTGSWLVGAHVDQVTIRPGGGLALDYRLKPEEAIDGLAALATLFGIAAGHRPRSLPGPTRLDGFRAEVDRWVADKATPKLRELLIAHDRAVPGLSLARVFDVR